MASIALGYPNRIGDAVLDGGHWVESMSLANIKDRQLARAARSVDLQQSSATFTMDFGKKVPVRILALVDHNISLSGRYRVEASNNADLSGAILSKSYSAWGTLAGGKWDINALDWLSNNFWLGGYTQDMVEGMTPTAWQMFPENVWARYWRITVIDPSNQLGFIDIGRVFIGEIFLQPVIKMAWGSSLGYEDATGVAISLSGAEFFDEREPVPVMRFSLPYMTEEEGFAKALELTRRAGISGEVFLIADPEDKQFASQRNFLGRLRALSALERARWRQTSMSFEIKRLS